MILIKIYNIMIILFCNILAIYSKYKLLLLIKMTKSIPT